MACKQLMVLKEMRLGIHGKRYEMSTNVYCVVRSSIYWKYGYEPSTNLRKNWKKKKVCSQLLGTY